MDQYHNPANPDAHYRTTGPELWEQTGGRITHFVAGLGTGGTVSGVARYLKEKKPDVKIIGADPIGSILRHYHQTGEMSEAHTYKIEGVGEDFIPSTLDFSLIDEVLACSDRDGLNLTRRLAREEAIFVGGSSGMAAWVALEVAKKAKPGDLVVVLFPDTGERYLSKVHNDDWMRDNHLLDLKVAHVADVMGRGRRVMPQLLSVEVGDTLKKALQLVEQHEVTQIPVFRGKEVVGTLYEGDILKTVIADPSAVDRPVESLMDAPLPTVRSDEPMDHVTKLLATRTSAVLVQRNGSVVGILTRFDMLQFIAGEE
jgi:cystathionine beta-synthase